MSKPYTYVRHKANSPWPNLSAALYVWRKLLFKRKARITITVGADISNASTGTNMWLKACGWKSGWHTKSNNETLIAYRVVGPCVEFCKYERRGEKLSFQDQRALSYARVAQISYYIQRGEAMRFPAIPWAEGGGYVATGDFSYYLEIV